MRSIGPSPRNQSVLVSPHQSRETPPDSHRDAKRADTRPTPTPNSQPWDAAQNYEQDWGQLIETERVHIWNGKIAGTGHIDAVRPDGSAIWVWLDNGMGRVLLIKGEDQLQRLDDHTRP